MAYYKLGRWLVLVLLGSFYFVQCSGRRAMKKRQLLEPDVNQTNDSEEEFIEWVNFVGSLNHSIFKAAAGENKMFASQTIIVDKDPSAGDFTSIQDAIDSLPPINLLRVVINVNAGTYTEKVEIPSSKAFIAIQGEGADNTIVEWGDTAATLGPNGKPLGTKRSATFAANSPYFIARNITFKNTTPVPEPGAVGKQAVAFRISGDTAAFLGCKFLGGQDTLFDHLGRHFYKDCYIEGSVDFIFGSALSLFEGCHVHAVAGKIGAVTAQGRSNATQDSGFSFVNCKVTGSGALYLGRAWGPFSRVVFAYTYMDDIILPKGWYDWGDPLRQLMVDLCLDSTEGSPRTFLEHQANTNQIYVLLAHSWVQTESFWKKGVIDIESYIRACSHSHTVEKEQGHWSVKVGANKDNMFYGRIKSSIGQLVQNRFYGCKKLRY